MAKNITLIIIALFIAQGVFSQSKTRADRFFEKGDYKNAAKYYEIELSKERHKKAVENIAIAYYNIFEYRKAKLYLKQLVKGRFGEKDKTYDNEYNFKLYQVLSALGDYETGLDYLKRLNERYEAWISTYTKGKLLIIDVDNLDFVDNQEDLGSVIDKIDAQIHGLF